MGLNKFRIVVVAILAISLAACAGNMESFSSLEKENSNTSNSTDSTPIIVDEGISEKTQALIKEVNEEEQTTDDLYSDIKKQEKKMKVINILSFLLALPFKATNGLVAQEKLKNPITSVLDKVLKVVEKAYSVDNSLREKLEKIVSQLDPELPSHQKAIEKIDKIHIKLDSFEERLDSLSEDLKGVANKIIVKIKLKKSTYLPIDPRAWLLKKAKGYFDDFKDDIDEIMAK